MAKPEIATVAISCYRQEEYLMDALNSIPPDPRIAEILIIDDASPGGARIREIESAHWTRPTRIISFSRNKGLAFVRNMSFIAASTPWVLPLDADDAMEPGGLEALLDETCGALPDIGFIYGDYIGFGTGLRYQPTELFEISLRDALLNNILPSCVLIRKEAWRRVRMVNEHGYDPETSRLGGFDDWLFWIELLAQGHRARHIDRVVWRKRQYIDNASMQGRAMRNRGEIERYMQHVLQKRYGLFFPTHVSGAEKQS